MEIRNYCIFVVNTYIDIVKAYLPQHVLLLASDLACVKIEGSAEISVSALRQRKLLATVGEKEKEKH